MLSINASLENLIPWWNRKHFLTLYEATMVTITPPPSMRPLLAVIFSIGIAFGSGLKYGFDTFTSHQKVSILEYERLELGMSMTDAEAILDGGIEIRKTPTITIFTWVNSDGSKIIATFENGKLEDKQQFGLK
jgi:hypothetical protein